MSENDTVKPCKNCSRPTTKKFCNKKCKKYHKIKQGFVLDIDKVKDLLEKNLRLYKSKIKQGFYTVYVHPSELGVTYEIINYGIIEIFGDGLIRNKFIYIDGKFTDESYFHKKLIDPAAVLDAYENFSDDEWVENESEVKEIIENK